MIRAGLRNKRDPTDWRESWNKRSSFHGTQINTKVDDIFVPLLPPQSSSSLSSGSYPRTWKEKSCLKKGQFLWKLFGLWSWQLAYYQCNQILLLSSLFPGVEKVWYQPASKHGNLGSRHQQFLLRCPFGFCSFHQIGKGSPSNQSLFFFGDITISKVANL